MSKRGSTYAAVVVIGLAPLAPQVQAQAPADAEGSGIEEVLVTAQRRQENLQDVPIALSAVSADELAAFGAEDLGDLNQVAPALHIQTQNGFLIPRIRGIGTVAAGSALENSVAVYVDGVYYVSQPGSLLSLNSIARVEVLRGPQGTLFGRNATGGLINVITRTPTSDSAGSASVSYGNYGALSSEAYFGGGLTESLAADIALRYAQQDEGYGVNRTTGRETGRLDEDIAARTKWVYRPTDGATFTLTGDYQSRDSSMVGGHTIPGAISAVSRLPYNGSPWDLEADTDANTELESSGASLTVNLDLGAINLTSISAYRSGDFLLQFDQDATPIPFTSLVYGMQRDEQTSQEIMLQSNADARVQWTAGVYYLDAPSELDPFIIMVPFPFPPGTIQARAESELGTESIAAYAQITTPLGARTNLTLGARYTKEDRTIDVILPAPSSNSMEVSKPTWRVVLDHAASDNVLLYASYNRGFKSGGFNALSAGDTYEEEILTAYEVGFKSELFDRHLRLNAAAFFYDFENLQIADFQTGVPQYVNAPKAEIYGVDFDIAAALGESLSITAGVSVLHDRFTDYPNAAVYTPRPNFPFGNVVTSESAKGNRLPLTPDATFNLNIRYERAAGPGIWSVDAGYYYNDGWYGGVGNTLRQDQYDRVSAAIGWRSASEHLGVRLWGRNLTDEEVATGLGANGLGTLVNYEPPRTYGVTITSKF